MASSSNLASDQINNFYRHIRDYWGRLSAPESGARSGMLNFGLWENGCPDLCVAQSHFLEKVINTIDRQASIASGLEIGCGIGGISIGLLKKMGGTKMTAVDISADQLDLAHQNAANAGVLQNLTLKEDDSMSMSFKDNLFDFSICIESSFHYEDKKKFFNENFRVLKAGGQAILADITCENLPRVTFRKGNHFESWKQYVTLAENAGFVTEHVENVGHLVFQQLYQHILAYNQKHKERNGKYWSVVLNNYAQLAEKNEMGYYFYRFRKPG